MSAISNAGDQIGTASVPADGKASPAFTTTHWSVVLAAGETPCRESTDALEKLCRTYWYPLYAYVRRRGYGVPDAQDLTQEFFSRLLEKQSLRDVHPSKGKFRSFLLACLNYFLAKEWRQAQAGKRGGGSIVFSLDAATAEERYRFEPSHDQTPERILERRWAITLLERALARLREECVASNKPELYEALKGRLTGEKGEHRYAEVAARLGMNEAAVKQAARRLRARYQEFLRAEIAQTVSAPHEVDEELRHLFAAVRP